jgi:hypothetical protein
LSTFKAQFIQIASLALMDHFQFCAKDGQDGQ